MKDTIYSFKRTEMKFLLTPYQYAALMREIENNIKPDDYPESHIENIYYDTPTDYLIRTSLEKPIYKEKLRLRTYGVPGAASPAFLEIKKKYDGIVYKRRIISGFKRNRRPILRSRFEVSTERQPDQTGDRCI